MLTFALLVILVFSSSSAVLAYNHMAGSTQVNRDPTTNQTAVVVSGLGLNLSLALNASQLTRGQSVNITVTLTSIRNNVNFVEADQGNWANLPEVNDNSCGLLGQPFGFLISQGYYTENNATSAIPLEIHQGGIFNCGTVFPFTEYVLNHIATMYWTPLE
jgi:hypothetical protein